MGNKKLLVYTDKFNEAYHHLQRLTQEAKDLSIKIQKCCLEMLQSVNGEDK